jgi:hypothetical protein
LFLGCGENVTGAVEVTAGSADNTTGGPDNAVASGSGTGGAGTGRGGKRGGYKAAAQEYEQQGLLDYSMEEKGEGVVGEEEDDENLLEEEDLEVMDTEPVGTDGKAGEVKQVAAADDRQVGVDGQGDEEAGEGGEAKAGCRG